MRIAKRAALVGLVSFLTSSAPAVLLTLWAPPAFAIARVIEGGRIRLHYKNASLKTIVEDIARATGETIIVDPALPGRFTITIGKAISREEALAVLEATLIMQGYAILQGDDGAMKVLAVTDAANGSRWAGPLSIQEDRNKLVTTLLPLEVARVEDVASRIQHLVSDQDLVVPYPPTNGLILVGTERRVRRMIELAQALDAGGQDELWVRTVRHRGATQAAQMLEEALRPASEAEAAFRREKEPRIWTDERSNTLLIMGSESQLERARVFLHELDQPVGVDTQIQVVPIYHRDAEELQTLLIQLAVGRALGDQKAGEAVLGELFAVVADGPTNSIIVDADPETFADLLGLIESLDRPKPRIQVDVTAFEVSNPTRLRLGVDWFLPVLEPNSDGTGGVMTIASNPSGGGLRGEIGDDLTFFGRVSRDPLLIPFTDAEGNVVDVLLPRETVVITAEAREVRTRALMEPRLLMTSGEEQRIFAGQNVPIVVGQSGENLSAIQQSSRVERRDVGVELRATANVGEEGKVALDLFIEISRVAPSVAGNVDSVGPTLDARRIETNVVLSDGELAIIGVSEEAGSRKSRSGTPFLMDVPVLGNLVKSGSQSAVDTHVVFAVQARILKNREEVIAESMRQRLALERKLTRVEGLRRNPKAPYAVLVTTRESRADADLLAESFERDGLRAQVGEWSYGGPPRYDVYLTGYRKLDVAGADSLRLRERGFEPQVVVLPGEVEIAESPGLRELGGSP